MRDYYEILGVDRSADDATLKSAFRKMAMEHHPDRNGGSEEASSRFKEINEAYSILSDAQKRAAYDRFGRALVLHIHGPRWRPDMTRYAPMLAPVIESLKQRSRYSEAELMAAVISACFAVGLKSDDGSLSTGLPVAQPAANGDSAIRFGDPGTVIDLLPGEEIQGFQLGRPNPGFAAFADAISAEIGAGLDMPKEVLLGLFQASYSASRAALEMAWQVFRVERARHVSQFCQPVYADVIAEAIARGMLDAPGFFEDALVRRAWLGATWMGPARPTIDPTKEASADEAYLNMGATTLTRITAERFGMDWETVAARRAEEIAMAPGPAAAAGAAPTDDPGGTDSDMGQS
jgi:lambda family phage portal protein